MVEIETHTCQSGKPQATPWSSHLAPPAEADLPNRGGAKTFCNVLKVVELFRPGFNDKVQGSLVGHYPTRGRLRVDFESGTYIRYLNPRARREPSEKQGSSFGGGDWKMQVSLVAEVSKEHLIYISNESLLQYRFTSSHSLSLIEMWPPCSLFSFLPPKKEIVLST